MIEIKNLYKNYDNPVLEDLNLTIEDSSIFGLIGINGAGKSTLMKLISGILEADSGSIKIDGDEVFENTNIKNKIFFLPDEPFYSRNTTPANLPNLYQVFYDIDLTSYFQYLAIFQIPEKKSMYNFSKGMKRQVFCALALAIKPKYLLLDEAFDGLDPLARLTLKKEVLRVQAENDMTVIISSHSLRELEDICDSYGLIDGRRITKSGDILGSTDAYSKFQLAFMEPKKKSDFLDIPYLTLNVDGKFVNIVIKGDKEKALEMLNALNPVVIDEMNVTFEDLFIIEVEARGYGRQ